MFSVLYNVCVLCLRALQAVLIEDSNSLWEEAPPTDLDLTASETRLETSTSACS